MQLNKKMGLTYVSPIFKEDLKVPLLKESPNPYLSLVKCDAYKISDKNAKSPYSL
ncbi:hypothetical protein QUF81_01935 [Peribacillus simplex]|uniref:hypothetical protein n=1 Tax=Peribacillus simplex TaxID=1478 RepID=UPI0025A23CDB|nr:hypothetical protein [Peribacillus simplex]MDM5292031.1 hypothetical protein [Peribacillus simplex]